MKLVQLFKRETAVFFVAVIMIVFGVAEVFTGFRHDFFGLVTEKDIFTTLIGAGLGICYLFSGILLLIFNIHTLFFSLVLLIIDILGRLIMTFSGMYPTNSTRQIIGIVGGTAIAAVFTVFVLIKYLRMVKNVHFKTEKNS